MQKDYYRIIIFSGLTLLLNLLIIRFSFNFPKEQAVSLMGFGTLGKLSMFTGRSIRILGCIGLIGSIIPFIKKFNRYVNLSFFTTAFSTVSAIILWAAVGSLFDIVGLLDLSLRLSTPIVLGAMAGMLCERTGVINIAIEGMMLTSACIGFTASLYLNNIWIGLFCAILSGGLIALLHAFLSITMITDQIVSGTVINILAVGLTGFIRRSFLLKARLTRTAILPIIEVPLLSKIPILGKIIFTNQPIVFIMMGLVVFISIMLFKTRWGLRTRSIGEHPEAADTVGINVFKMRYLNVILGGSIAGLAGAWFSLETTGSFDDLMTNGKDSAKKAKINPPANAPTGCPTGSSKDLIQIIPLPESILLLTEYGWVSQANISVRF